MILTLIWRFLAAHPQKIAGFILVTLGGVQANITTIQEFLSPRAYAFLNMALGCAVAALGFINTQAAKKQQETNE